MRIEQLNSLLQWEKLSLIHQLVYIKQYTVYIDSLFQETTLEFAVCCLHLEWIMRCTCCMTFTCWQQSSRALVQAAHAISPFRAYDLSLPGRRRADCRYQLSLQTVSWKGRRDYISHGLRHLFAYNGAVMSILRCLVNLYKLWDEIVRPPADLVSTPTIRLRKDCRMA